MTWKDPASKEGAAFKEQVLSPGSSARLEQSGLLGVSSSAPAAEEGAAPSSGNALSGAAAGGGSAHTHTVLPRHRGTVERYFERK